MVAWDYRRSAFKLNGARRESRMKRRGTRTPKHRNVGVRPDAAPCG